MDKTNHAHIRVAAPNDFKNKETTGQSTKQEVETGTDVPVFQKKTGANGSILVGCRIVNDDGTVNRTPHWFELAKVKWAMPYKQDGSTLFLLDLPERTV